MITHNPRNKRRNLKKALHSIPINNNSDSHPKAFIPHAQNHLTVKYQIQLNPRREAIQNLTRAVSSNKQPAQTTAWQNEIRKAFRYRMHTNGGQGQQDKQSYLKGLIKHQSLEMGKGKIKRRSYNKLNQYASIQKSPYRTISKQGGLSHSLQNRASRQKKFTLSKKNILPSNKSKETIKQTECTDSAKQQIRQLLRNEQYETAFRVLEQFDDRANIDLQLLQMKGSCLLSLKRFAEALSCYSNIFKVNKQHSKKAYISAALCQNQLNHADKCIYYINECIFLFPDYYESYYFKGKLLFKQKFYSKAIQVLNQAELFNSSKKEIKYLIAECYRSLGQRSKALQYYEPNITTISLKNVKHAIECGSLLIQCDRIDQALKKLECCKQLLDSSQQFQKQKISLSYYLGLIYYMKQDYEGCIMRGEEALRGDQQWIRKALKMMNACKIVQHNYYSSIELLRRRELLLNSQQDLQIQATFNEGIFLLMKKRTQQGVEKLAQLDSLCQGKLDIFSKQIWRRYTLFIAYGLFIAGRYGQCLERIQKQKQIGIQPYFMESIQHTESICAALIRYNKQQYSASEEILKTCFQKYPHRAQTQLYLAILYFKIYSEASSQRQVQLKALILRHLTKCAETFAPLNNNYSAFIFYYRGLFYAWQGQWVLSACDLDVAVQKSQDNYYNFYYLRAIVMANLQNYRQAINDSSCAISVRQESAPAYILRARCFQIDGNPGEAFADLQTFIALRPQDKQVHKFAGHLLFENGAFQDALQAYSQGEVNERDIEVYLTRSKTNFLIGNFADAAQDMLRVSQILGDSPEAYFDYLMMKWTSQLLYQMKEKQDNFLFDKQILKQNLDKLNDIYRSSSNSEYKYGKIFKLSEYLTLSSLCHFYLEDYDKCTDCLVEAVELKRATLQAEDSGQFEEDDSQKLIFISQMYYNLAICCCMQLDYPNAQRYLVQSQISPDSHNYPAYIQLLQQIKGVVEVTEKDSNSDLFSLKNKLSRYTPMIRVPFLHKLRQTNQYRQLKLCIPYPKVQPPQINPSFDTDLLLEIDMAQLERRTEAPWIYRQKNSIKFTERIDVYSRFQMEKSETEQKKNYIGNSHFSDSSCDDLSINLKQQLKLDDKLEEKLKKLISKGK